MPELPDIVVYLDALSRLLRGKKIQKAIVKSPFLLRTFDPPLETVEGQSIAGFSRMGKRVIWHCDDETRMVFHLMIAGRFHWKPEKSQLPKSKTDLAAFQFDHGTMMLTEASSNKRASLHIVAPRDNLVQFDRGGLEVLTCSIDQFRERIKSQNRTLKRALTDPTIFSGIGNAYSDEILLESRLSPLKRTRQLSEEEIRRLHTGVQETMQVWIEKLLHATGDSFPEKVTAFRPEMMAHGKFKLPCPKCQTPIQRIRYAENECNYCPKCQTGGKILADRSLSRLLKDDWPKTIEELEE